MMRRKKGEYFKRVADAPTPLKNQVQRVVAFNEVDVMGIVWYGRYAIYFEEAAAALGRECGLSYQDFYHAKLRAPIVQFHVDYFSPLRLDDKFTIEAAIIWNEGARLNTEYCIYQQDGSIAVAGYSVQMFSGVDTADFLLTSPELWLQCRNQWLNGAYKCLQ